MVERIPALLAALCLSVYWFWVPVKLIRLGRKLGKDPNALPRERVGQAMRLLWYPCIMALLVGLWLAASVAHLDRWPPAAQIPLQPLWTLRPLGPWWWAAMLPAGSLCLLCTLFTFVCWRKMGRSWRIGIDPNEKLALVSTGPYRYVRHPIYALRMVINLCAFVMAPTLWILLTAGIDILLLQIEARREERYMEAQHGAEYARYKNSVGRFIPRPFLG
jgi:protein-S-isoprenylcysteine O-methyltransferase Ste14